MHKSRLVGVWINVRITPKADIHCVAANLRYGPITTFRAATNERDFGLPSLIKRPQQQLTRRSLKRHQQAKCTKQPADWAAFPSSTIRR
jgi:hypothetical protein